MKDIIDKHYTEYYKYYRKVCLSYTKDIELADELLHETYLGFLKAKTTTIIQFNTDNKLHFLGINILRSLWQKKKQVKKHIDGQTSTLFKSNNSFDISELNLRLLKENHYSENEYNVLESAIRTLLNDSNKSMSIIIFLQANETSISEIHRHSKISRPYLTKHYNKGKQYLKQYIENAD